MLASLAVMLIGLVIIIVNASTGIGAFNLGVEFSGGADFHIDIGQEFQNDDIAAIVREITDQDAPQVQRVTGTYQVMIRILSIDQETRTSLINAISERYGNTYEDFSYSDISATVSADMQRSAILAVISACVAMLIYISLRFKDIRMGSASIMGLVHDVLIVMAFYGMLRIPINYSFIAALLTVLGYSINASIVLFDRVRENRGIMRKAPLIDLINVSVNQTLRRSIFTSLTTLIVVLVLFILGVASIREFTLPIMIGIAAGTYSSIFLVGPFWYLLSNKEDEVAVAGGAGTVEKLPVSNEPAEKANKVKKAAGENESSEKQFSSTPRKKKKK